MEFASNDDAMLSALVTAQYLPRLSDGFEREVRRLGFRVERKEHWEDDDGRRCFALVLTHASGRYQLGLRDCLEELILVDREEHPARADPKLADSDYAERKLADIIAGRLEILRILAECRSTEEVHRRIAELGDRFEWIRVITEEEPR